MGTLRTLCACLCADLYRASNMGCGGSDEQQDETAIPEDAKMLFDYVTHYPDWNDEQRREAENNLFEIFGPVTEEEDDDFERIIGENFLHVVDVFQDVFLDLYINWSRRNKKCEELTQKFKGDAGKEAMLKVFEDHSGFKDKVSKTQFLGTLDELCEPDPSRKK